MSRPTPSYSHDLNDLCNNGKKIVSSFDEAKVEVLKWRVSECSALRNRTKLETDSDWTSFIEATPGAVIRGEDGELKTIDLTVLLKRCYFLAFSMPPSPLVSARSRSASLASNKSAIESDSPEMPSLSI